MEFIVYNQTCKARYDLPTQKALERLRSSYGDVEVKRIDGESWCVRIRVDLKGVETPLASIGDCAYEAAKRLERVMHS